MAEFTGRRNELSYCGNLPLPPSLPPSHTKVARKASQIPRAGWLLSRCALESVRGVRVARPRVDRSSRFAFPVNYVFALGISRGFGPTNSPKGPDALAPLSAISRRLGHARGGCGWGWRCAG